MFSFDEELFTTASAKISSSIDGLEGLKGIVNAINSFSLDCDFKGEITSIVNGIITIQNTLNELEEDVNKTKALISLMNSGAFGSGNIDINTLFALKELLDSGLFGANQSGPILLLEKASNDYESLTDIEKQQYADLIAVLEKYEFITTEGVWNHSMYDFMLSSQQGGCGFAANTNIIIDMYSKMENGEELFYQKYDFPMYYTDTSGEKHYNYDTLFASHFLSSMDRFSRQIIPGVDIYIPSFWPKWNTSMIDSFVGGTVPVVGGKMSGVGGTTTFQRVNALKYEFSDMSMDTTEYMMQGNISQYSNEYSNHDYTVVLAHDKFTLTSVEGVSKTYDGSHFMSITGVTSDGKYIVASWGNQYILDDYSDASLCFIDFR